MPGLRLKIPVFFYLLLLVSSASAHVAGVTDTGIKISRDGLTLVYTVPADNLKELYPVGFITPDVAMMQAIADGFVVRNNGEPCIPDTGATRSLEAIESEQFEFNYDCHGLLKTLSIEYKLFINEEKTHENFARISLLNRTQNVTFSNNYPVHTVPVEAIVRRLAERREAGADVVESSSAFNTHYFPVGLKHILHGYDHVLFILALLLLPLTLKRLLGLVTTFTVAHSVTLALSVLGIVTLPPLYVELAIALSIVYVAVETYLVSRCSGGQPADSGVWRRRLLTTFLFGLIHGFGFSFILRQMGLGDQILGSLLFFNLGVEVGQVLIILLAYPLITLLFKRLGYQRCIPWPTAIVGLAGLFWLVQRVAAL